MFLPCLSLLLFSSLTSVALPSCPSDACGLNVLNGQQPPYINKHPGHTFPEPPPPPFPPSPGRETIYGVLSKDPRFSRVLKAVDYIDEVAALLNDTTVGLTFFAPHNKALRAPNKESSHALFFVDETAPVDTYDFETTLSELEDLDCQFESPLGDDVDDDGGDDNHDENDDDDDEKREERKRFLKKILRAILEYHILPRRLDVVALSDKTTHPTNLSFKGAMGGRPVRIRTEQKSIPPILVLNLYSHVVRPDMEASNGLIHVIDHPLFPPLSAFQELFMAPKYFSIFTSVIQRTGLTDELDFSYKFGDDNGEGYPEGSPAVTVFAPTNRAFDALPRDLQFFLFSPFGRRALKKLVQYHIVPDFVLHADYTFNHSSDKSTEAYEFHNRVSRPSSLDNELISWFDDHEPNAFQQAVMAMLDYAGCDSDEEELDELLRDDEFDAISKKHKHKHKKHKHKKHKHKKHKKPKHPKKPRLPCPEPISLLDITLPTLYEHHPLHAHIGKFKVALPIPGDKHPYHIKTKFSVDGYEIDLADLVALNGAIHVIDKLLDPRGPRHGYGVGHEDEVTEPWNSWQTWLPAWAET